MIFSELFSIGRFDELKDYETAIKAVEHLSETNPQLINIESTKLLAMEIIQSNHSCIIAFVKKLEDVIKIIDNPTNFINDVTNANVFSFYFYFEGFSNYHGSYIVPVTDNCNQCW